ncbi:hypothetical protein AAZX31_18G072200 [Glycine max]|uniref:Serine-rich protein-like protein n=2 Tax=Glycine subgen. Soja TaxID=1462606 RepID=K7MQG3_SOYBN|nr:hypothetical protein JHK87_049295 [Glycine soja]KAG4935338.1 hypothetical protein JHK85_050257 [Glycine max]KAH1153654.1 hypothetical protein GYH30_049335 [Glycine max]KAH1197170.1 hypothetical protein GmHk_18G051018 [Glycine max]KHN31685.1 hypothetical protein glysoja_022550 [Glycine soja]
MEPKVEQKPPRMKLSKLPELDVETFQNSHVLVSPTTSQNSHMFMSPTSQPITRKNSNGRLNCLCSPTTHAGSFRCRHHRSSGIRRGKSVGSNLAELGSKAGSISDSLHAQ